jgi:PhnB protein
VGVEEPRGPIAAVWDGAADLQEWSIPPQRRAARRDPDRRGARSGPSHSMEESIMAVRHIPAGYHSLTPCLICKGAARALDFYKKAFGAVELMRMPGPEGRLMHAEFKVGDSPIMIADEFPDRHAISPLTLGGTPVHLMLYFEDVDGRFRKAVAAGATVRNEVQDQFYGDRSGTIVDPFGHVWTLATHIEDVSPEEMKRRMAAMKKD